MADPFPIFEDSTSDVLDIPVDNEIGATVDPLPPRPHGWTIGFDYTRGDLALNSRGQMSKLTGLDCLNQWLAAQLFITRYESPAYGSNTGTSIGSLLGGRIVDGLTLATIETEIRRVALQHDRIRTVSVSRCFSIGSKVYAYIEYATDNATSSLLSEVS